jgi:probable HAF family extracellular repeat protein
MDEFTVDHSRRGWLRRREGSARRRAVTCKFVLGLSLAMGCQSALAQVMYRMTSLGHVDGCTSSAPEALAFNGAGQATGAACNANGDTHAFLWKNNGTPMIDLGPPQAGSVSEGTGINAPGLVAGDASDSTGQFAFEWSGNGPMNRIYDTLGGDTIYPSPPNSRGQLTGSAFTAGDASTRAFVWMNNGSPIQSLGTLGGDSSSGNAINASTQIAGTSDLPGNTKHHAFIWRPDGTGLQDLGTLGGNFSEGLYINASGQVAGSSRVVINTVVRTHVFLWRNDGTPMEDVGTLGGYDSFAMALNKAGQITGDSYLHGRQKNSLHAFVWLNDGTPIKDLGTLGGGGSSGNDINSSGQVTGQADAADGIGYAFLWRNDGTKMQDLNSLIDPTDPLKPYITLTNGRFINVSGDVLADGRDSRTGQNPLQSLYLLHGTVFTLTPRSLAFGSHPIHTTSAPKSVTLTNASGKFAGITGIALAGSAPNQFASTDNCGKGLAGHASCTIKVTFMPTTKGAKSAVLNVNGGNGGLTAVSLSGTGT